MKNKKKILFVFGTRPEAIKLACLIRELKKDPWFHTFVCLTSQHTKMLSQVMTFFKIKEDFDLHVMRQNQDLYDVTINVLRHIKGVLSKLKPHMVIVQGDTTSALVASLAAFYEKIPTAHVEAGLRTNNKNQPYPEEMNRHLISSLVDIHLAPTTQAKKNLENEGVESRKIFITGNTGIDALFFVCNKANKTTPDFFKRICRYRKVKKIILVTGHRRENFGKPFQEICFSLREIALKYPDIDIIYPVHLNPNVRMPVFEILKGNQNVHLLEPLNYPDFIWLMNQSHFVVTDSGGLQEEAPALGKPVLVMRDVTERPEGIECGAVKLIGTNKNRIVSNIIKLISDRKSFEAMSIRRNIYGDGKASVRIKNILKQCLNKKQ